MNKEKFNWYNPKDGNVYTPFLAKKMIFVNSDQELEENGFIKFFYDIPSYDSKYYTHAPHGELHNIDDCEKTDEGYIQHFDVVEKPIEDVQRTILEELTEKAHEFDNQLVNDEMVIASSLGFKIDADKRSQDNLRGLINNITTEKTIFKDSENNNHEVTKADLEVMLSECIANGQNLYLQKWQLAETIKACKSIDELKSIKIEFTQADFSKK